MPVRGDLQARLEGIALPAEADAAQTGACAGVESGSSVPAGGSIPPNVPLEPAVSHESGSLPALPADLGHPGGNSPVWATLGTLSAEVEKLRFELAMAHRVEARQRSEIVKLERRIAVLETERRELIDQVAHRDRLLTLIQSSRSWRWTQALRRRLGRR